MQVHVHSIQLAIPLSPQCIDVKMLPFKCPRQPELQAALLKELRTVLEIEDFHGLRKTRLLHPKP